MQRNFKVGDRVRCTKSYHPQAIGKIGTVIHNFDLGVSVQFDDNIKGHDADCGKRGHCWNFFWGDTDQCIEHVEVEKHKPIVIYQRGKEVIALDKSTGKKGIAKCSPEDEFNFETGANLAFDRLMNRIIEVGDRVKVIHDEYQYPTYAKWVNENAKDYAVYFAYGRWIVDETNIKEERFTVVAKAPHESGNDMLYLIQNDYKRCYLIGERGIENMLSSAK